MKKKLITAGIIICIIIVASIYFSTPAPIVNDPSEVQIHWVSVLNNKYESQDITNFIDREKLVQMISRYDRGKLPYHFAPYQAAAGDIDIGYFDHGELKHISLGSVNVVYESADKGGYKIYDSSKLLGEIQKNIEKGKVLSVSDVSNLAAGAAREDIIKKFGLPTEDIGSGAYIYLYAMEDKQFVVLFFSSDDKLTRCKLRASDGTEKVLIGQ